MRLEFHRIQKIMRIIFLMKFKIYTDGACSESWKRRLGGYYLDNDLNQSNVSGSENNTTNNRMELMAPIGTKKNKKEI